MALMTPGAVRVGTGEWGQALSEVEGVAEPLAAVLRALPGPASRRTSLDDSGVQQGHHPLPARARRHCPATAIRCLCPTVALVGALSPITATTRQVIGTGHCPGHRGRRLRPTAWEHFRPCIVERHPAGPGAGPPSLGPRRDRRLRRRSDASSGAPPRTRVRARERPAQFTSRSRGHRVVF